MSFAKILRQTSTAIPRSHHSVGHGVKIDTMYAMERRLDYEMETSVRPRYLPRVCPVPRMADLVGHVLQSVSGRVVFPGWEWVDSRRYVFHLYITRELAKEWQTLHSQLAGRDISATTLPWFIMKHTVKLLESAMRLWLVEAAQLSPHGLSV